MLTRLIQRTEAVGEDRIEYEYEYRDAEYEYEPSPVNLTNNNEQWWQETYLFSELVLKLHQAEKIPGSGQCYALAPHPALGGPDPFAGDAIDPRFVVVTEVFVWQSICAQSLGVGQ
jgi:hypothetical protein